MINKIKIAILGFNGKVSQEILKLFKEDDLVSIKAATIKKDDKLSATMNEFVKSNHVNVYNDLKLIYSQVDAIIDFTSPSYSLEAARLNQDYNKLHIIGTTGFNEEEIKQLKNYAKKTRIIYSANMSIGINLIKKSVKSIINDFDKEVDINILDIHNKNKKDKPSGTSLMLADLIKNSNKEIQHKNIELLSIRAGDIIAEQHLIFSILGEQIEIIHKATNRSIYAKGALLALKWGINQSVGYFTMQDVLETNSTSE